MKTSERFWKFVNRPAEAVCWDWQGARFRGYGRFSHTTLDGQRGQLAHRFSYEQAFGVIPKGLLVCHTCDNPPCVNPAHLFVGTSLDNTIDRKSKGRSNGSPGEKHGMSKLTDIIVLELLRRRAEGVLLKQLAADYGITLTTVSEIAKRKTWRHLGVVEARPSFSTNFHARKTHCRNGHPYDEANTVHISGERRCRICKNEVLRRWRARG